MSDSASNITVPVDLTNPGQFFACCGLLELADRLWPGAVGWFESERFLVAGPSACSVRALFDHVSESTVDNTMTPAQNTRLEALSVMTEKQRKATPGLDDEKKELESLRRECPIVLSGAVAFRVDWFRDELAGGSRFKTWAGQQSVLHIAAAMHAGVKAAGVNSGESLWNSARGIDLPFNFDSDLGGQGSAFDIGFSFDALAGSGTTRIQGTCRPALEFLAFVGLQRFRPLELKGENRFIFATWHTPLAPSVAAACACRSIEVGRESAYEFRLLYRTKYLKSFLPAVPIQGDHDE